MADNRGTSASGSTTSTLNVPINHQSVPVSPGGMSASSALYMDVSSVETIILDDGEATNSAAMQIIANEESNPISPNSQLQLCPSGMSASGACSADEVFGDKFKTNQAKPSHNQASNYREPDGQAFSRSHASVTSSLPGDITSADEIVLGEVEASNSGAAQARTNDFDATQVLPKRILRSSRGKMSSPGSSRRVEAPGQKIALGRCEKPKSADVKARLHTQHNRPSSELQRMIKTVCGQTSARIIIQRCDKTADKNS